MQYEIIEGTIKEGDIVINILDKKSIPTLCEKNEYGHLGIKVSGWFSWLPIGSRHKKIIVKY